MYPDKNIMTKAKSQITADFIITISIALVIFLAVFAIADKRNNMLDSTRERLYAKQEADKAALEINSVFLAGIGTNKSVFLPATLKGGSPYNITVYPSLRIVNIDYYFNGEKRNYQAGILTFNASSISGINGTIRLSNINEAVIIEK